MGKGGKGKGNNYYHNNGYRPQYGRGNGPYNSNDPVCGINKMVSQMDSFVQGIQGLDKMVTLGRSMANAAAENAEKERAKSSDSTEKLLEKM
eukprot:3727431-Karenia_brevis.AAC.1